MPEWTPERIEAEALRRYPEDFRTGGVTAMEQRAFEAGASWADAEVRAPLEAEHRAEIAALVDEGTRQKRRAIAAEAKVRAGLAALSDDDPLGVHKSCPPLDEHDDWVWLKDAQEQIRNARAALTDPTPDEPTDD